MKKQARRGFTLPEILVTVSVVAILGATVVPAVVQYVSRGNSPSMQMDLNEIRNAIAGYVADTRTFPTSFYDLEVVPTTGFQTATWQGPYTSAPLSGTGTSTATYSNRGMNVTLGPSISRANGFLKTTLSFAVSTAHCQDLYDLDKAIDGGTGLAADAATMATTGMLIWTTCTTTANAASPILRLMAVGS